ncbi:hypothetical protein EB796_015612 [Bugula neritina]|uniref:Uncharacterized protein n=1 Tax=Bugula neritina TaxID=10212 RepID=A0A7J7JKW2_BUGNE|nr:hypothetical protein EB796_015612 [Bugula neritina]
MKLLADRVDNTHFLDVLLTVLSSTADNECCMAICEAFMVLELPPHIVFHDLINVLKEWHGKGSSQLV